VNRLPYVTDQAQFGMPEYWQRISVERRGDCEDYAMEKQHKWNAWDHIPAHLRER
jgi:predicted transglutaminase-like cysteine proteinase